MEGPRRARGSAPRLAAAALLGLFAGLSFWEMSGDSLTSDERVHLPAGYAYWKAREFRLNPEHPPLIKLICALPLLPLNPRLPSTAPDPGMTYHAFQPIFGTRFLSGHDPDRLLFHGRLPAIVIGLALLGLLASWSRELHGSAAAGLATLALAAFEPTLLAHSHYVTDDVGLACFVVAAFYFLWRFARTARARDLLLASAGLGLALATKYSALVLVPVFLLLLWTRWPAGESGAEGGRWTIRSWPRRAATPMVACLGACLVMAAIVQASYLFSGDLSLYLRGIEELRANRPPINPAYVHGRFFSDMVFWYPLYAYLIKTPLPILIAVGLGLFATLGDRRRAAGTALFILVPAAVYTLAVCLFAYNYGVRYLIPTTSLLLVGAGGAVVDLLARGRAGRLAAAGLGLWLLASVLHAAPHFIGYFNELVGGPGNGPYFLQDSNLDWGQDLKRLARYQKENGIAELYLAYWGPTQPEQYGIRWVPWTEAARLDPPPPGVYAISVNRLIELKRRVTLGGEDSRLDWLDRFRPAARVGCSIFVYRIPEPGAP